MEISTITPVYNEPRLRSTLQSILSQRDVEAVETIVVDGGSTDETVGIIDDFRDVIDVLIREPDDGVYDAMNKGIRRASGDVVGILNADDRYQHEFVLSDVEEELRNGDVDACYGDLVYVDEQDEPVRYWKSGHYRPYRFRLGWMPPHPTFFARRQVYEENDLFDLDFTIAADYELMLRLLFKEGITVTYLDEVLVRMATGGKSNESVTNVVRANMEVYQAWRRNRLRGGFLVPVVKPLRKIVQYVNDPGC